MVKPRKTKAEDSGPLIRHQKLCLSIDLDKRRIHGYTEMEVAVPDSGVIGLHADNLEIESILVDGERVEYECFPHYQPVELENRWCSVSTAASAAEAAAATYLGVLEKETMPNLIIYCCPPISQVSEQQTMENGEPSPSDEQKQNVRLVRIKYWVDKAETGVHFEANMLYTDNQIRRAGCWFPCLDHTYQQCCYDMEFTVGRNLVAVSTGSLLRQVLSKDDPPLKTYVYKVDVAVAARWISLAVGPFEILPDQHSGLISYMCLPPYLSPLQNTVGFFYAAFSHYEDYLSASFPFGSYKQVFIPPEMIISSLNLGASMGIFSSHVLFDEKIIDQTIETRIKIALALARQWFGVYITAESPNDEWLLAGLAGYMTDSFIKLNLGNNEARYRRFKANSAVCEMDDSGATALSPSSFKDLYGTEFIGLYGKLRAWKSVAVLQMLEKQMGPESFRKILQRIVSRAGETAHLLRTLSTKEFRQYANKIGNLDRPFLKEFFPRWVGSCGCPVLRTGLSYNKRKNLVELAVLRECSAAPESIAASVSHTNTDSESREGDGGWPGMMSIRVHELDGTYDHPILPMAGETWQLLEIQCHSKIASKRFQKPKKGSKPDGSDDNGDGPSALDTRSNGDSPLLWLRADPEMEYLAEIHFNQPIHMWIRQLENDKDVVAQAQAIGALEALPQLPFPVVNALNAFLSDSKAFWRVRVDAAFSLASTASEENDWAGLLHLVKFFQSRRFDSKIGLPKPNDFRDFPEYFVLEAIPHAISMVRASDMKSPREAVEFILQLLKYNDNSGNPYSDVFWLAALIESVGELEFGQQSILFLSSLLKRIDRLLQFDRLMPSYNGILTISCIRTLTRIGLKLAGLIPLDRISELIKPFRDLKTLWQVRVEASRSLLDIELHSAGIDAALLMFIKYLEEEPSLRGQIKLGSHAVRLCQTSGRSECKGDAKSSTLVALLRLLESRIAFNNVFLRHHLFCILQVLAKRSPTLYGVPRPQTFQLSYLEACCEQFAALATQSKSPEPPIDVPNISNEALPISEAPKDLIDDRPPDTIIDNLSTPDLATVEVSAEKSNLPEPIDAPNPSDMAKQSDAANPSIDALPIPEPEPSREVDTISNSHERKKSIFKFRVKQSAASSRADDVDNLTSEKSHQGAPNEAERVASSSNSVEAPMRNLSRAAMSVSDNQNIEETNSCYDHGSRMSVSIGSVKIIDEPDELGKELQCTADSSIASVLPLSEDNYKADSSAPQYPSLVTLSNLKPGEDGSSMVAPDANLHGRKEKEKKKKKDKEKKRKREEYKGRHDDPEYLERKRLKKEKKQKEKLKEKEMSKLLSSEPKQLSSEPKLLHSEQKQVSDGLQGKRDPDMLKDVAEDESRIASAAAEVEPSEPSRSKVVVTRVESKPEASEGTSAPPKFRIKLKGRTLGSSK